MGARGIQQLEKSNLPNRLSVRSEGSMFLALKLAFFILLLLLLLNDAQELVALCFSLLRKHYLTLDELSSSSPIKFGSLFAGFLRLFFLLSTSFTLTLFEGTLGTQGVDLTLTVGCTLLKLSKSLNLKLLLFFNSAFLCGALLFL